MSSPEVNLFGWELICNSVRADLETNTDILICFTHLVLVRHGFKCIGIGDSTALVGDEPKTENLPTGWKDTQSLRYVYKGKLYNLKATKLDDGVMLNFVRPDERTVSMIHLYDSAVANRNIGSIEDMIPTYKDLFKTVNADLIEKVTESKNTKEQPTQTDAVSPSHRHHNSPLMDPFPLNRGGPGYGAGPMGLIDPMGVRDVGRDDLHPFGFPRGGGGGLIPDLGIGGGGGGNLYVPPRMPPQGPAGPNAGVPGGSVPPGARFDPFRPPDPERFPGPPRRPNAPDNDEFGPPGWDDMYM